MGFVRLGYILHMTMYDYFSHNDLIIGLIFSQYINQLAYIFQLGMIHMTGVSATVVMVVIEFDFDFF